MANKKYYFIRKIISVIIAGVVLLCSITVYGQNQGPYIQSKVIQRLSLIHI